MTKALAFALIAAVGFGFCSLEVTKINANILTNKLS
jgi:hypothetical protein